MIGIQFVFRIPSTIFGLPWHELKALHKEQIISEKSGDAKKRHRRKLLGKLSTDLDYLESLVTEVKMKPISEDIINADEFVKQEAEEAISFLKERQEFWSQFKPMYCK